MRHIPNERINSNGLAKITRDLSDKKLENIPVSETEKALVEIWKKILRIDNVCTQDNFFYLGGHSLKAMILTATVNKKMGVDISVNDIFSNPTLKSLAKYIDKSNKSEFGSIERIEKRDVYKVSAAQRRMYTLYQFDSQGTTYNLPTALMLKGELCEEKIQEAFENLINRHEIFKTSFEVVNNNVNQRIHSKVSFKLDSIEYLNAKDEEIEELIREFVQPFDLTKAPLLRVKLVKLENLKYLLLYDMHHIISDGASMEIIVDEISRIYNGEKLDMPRIQYKDYAAWQKKLSTTKEMQTHKTYWLERFKGELPVLNMPLDFVRPAIKKYEGDTVKFKIEKNLSEKLRFFGYENDVTLHMSLLTIFNILLSRYSGQEDIIIGTPTAGRVHNDISKCVGMFVNTLPMRNYPVGDKTFLELLSEVKENALNAYEHQKYQFDNLVEELNVSGDMGRNPLFDSMFVLQNTEKSEVKIDGLVVSPYEINDKTAKLDLILIANEREDFIELVFNYCTALFNQSTIERMCMHFLKITQEVLIKKDIRLMDIDILLEEEKEIILKDFNNSITSISEQNTISKLFEEQVKKTPESIAISASGKSLTYYELNRRANQLANYLCEKGAAPGKIVGIMLERSLEMAIGIMGILKSGAAYLPIDPFYPSERITHILNDAQVINLLTHSGNDYYSKNISCIFIDEEGKNFADYSSKNLKVRQNFDDLAYVIYTSGSTGKPKGVAVEHKSIINTLLWRKKEYGLVNSDVVLQLSSFSFDSFITNFFTPLFSGASVVFLNEEEAKDSEAIRKVIVINGITHFTCVPILYSSILERMSVEDSKSLKVITLAGESVPESLVKQSKKLNPKIELFNEYGPTECSVASTVLRNMQLEDRITIGKPIDNVQIYILKNNQMQPIGVPGELYISGKGVTRGYINRPDLNKEKFIPNPYIPGEIMYRTGDLARWLSDGNIEYLGRIDNQVKIRGYRIELGEIENCLLNQDEVLQATVVEINKQGHKYLCAYIVCNTKISVSILKNRISKLLPTFMIPTYIIELESLPLTPNGKIDRKNLPHPIEYPAEENTRHSKTPVQELVASIWSKVLGVENIRNEDSFFELGGHSLLATQVVFRLQDAFQIEFSIRELFEYPTVASLADRLIQIRQGDKEYNLPSLKPLERGKQHSLSYAQQRLWFINQLEGPSTLYNIVLPLHILGKINEKAIGYSLQEIINRHEVLRTTFVENEGKPLQIIESFFELQLSIIDLSEDGIEDIQSEKVQQLIRKLSEHKFDLSSGPLFCSHLLKLSKDESVLIMVMHHIISDGWSNEVLIRELGQFYEAFMTGQLSSIPDLPIQYVDYAAWQREWLEGQVLENQLAYWTKNLKNAPSFLEIPTDYSRPLVLSFRGAKLKFELSEDLSLTLKNMSLNMGVSMFMILMAAYKMLLFRVTEKEDILVGFPVANRNRSEVDGLIGFFVNTLILRSDLSGNPTFKDVLQQVRKKALEAYANQDIPFEKLVEELCPERNRSYSPLCQVMFVLQKEVFPSSFKSHDIQISVCDVDYKSSKFDLTFFMKECEKQLVGYVEYSTDLFKKETIEKLIMKFNLLLTSIVENPKLRLREIPLYSKDDFIPTDELDELFD